MPGFTLRPYRPLFADHFVDAVQLALLRKTFVTDSFDASKLHCIFHGRDRVFTFFNPHPHVIEEVENLTAFQRLHRLSAAGAIVGAYAGCGDSSTEKVLLGLQDCNNRFEWFPLGEDTGDDVVRLTFQLLYLPDLHVYCTAPCPGLAGCEEPEINHKELETRK